MRAELKVVEGKHQGAVIPINRKKFLVGRESDCQLRPNSDLVSRHHCVFAVDEYGVRLRDLGSTNGTYVNNERISGQVALNDGDKVRIGKLVFQVSIRSSVPAAQAVPVKPASSGVPVGILPPITGDSGSSNTVDFSLSESGMLKIDESNNKTGVFGGDTTLLSPNGTARTSVDLPLGGLTPVPLTTTAPVVSPAQETQLIPPVAPPPGITPPPAVPPVVGGTNGNGANGHGSVAPPPATAAPEAAAAPKASAADIIRQYMQKRGQS
ncbi:MAG: FHA domain-containing protein [Planctomycetales bacterium]